MKRSSLRDRLAAMEPSEIRAAMRATAEGDRTYRADLVSLIFGDDDHFEVSKILEEDWEAYIAASEELERVQRGEKYFNLQPSLTPRRGDALTSLVDYLRNISTVEQLGPVLASVYSSGSRRRNQHPPHVDLQLSADPADGPQLRLFASKLYFWFAFVVTVDGRVLIPTAFQDETGRYRSAHRRLTSNTPWLIAVDPVVRGTAYALASTGDFLRAPVEQAGLEIALQRGVDDIRNARKHVLFFMEYPFGS